MKPVLEEAFSPKRLALAGLLQPNAVNALWRRYGKSPGHVGWSRIWSLFVLTRWCETMNVSP